MEILLDLEFLIEFVSLVDCVKESPVDEETSNQVLFRPDEDLIAFLMLAPHLTLFLLYLKQERGEVNIRQMLAMHMLDRDLYSYEVKSALVIELLIGQIVTLRQLDEIVLRFVQHQPLKDLEVVLHDRLSHALEIWDKQQLIVQVEYRRGQFVYLQNDFFVY